MDNCTINIENVSKIYKLYDKPMDRLYESLGITSKSKKRFKEFYALNDINFRVYEGETVGIIGTNGSGKSTMLKIITGVLNQTSGNIQVNGRVSALLELGAGFNTEYTGIENVYLNGTMLGYTKEEIDAKLEDIINFADIGDFINQPVKAYSSGMFVRLAFAVAINIDPEILIIDEALSVGDVFFQAKCYKKFDEFKKQGKTILFVTHDLSSIITYCDRAILLNQGDKLAEGSPKDIVDKYKKILSKGVLDDKQNEVDNEVIEDDDSLIVNPDSIEYGNGNATIMKFSLNDENGIVTNTFEKGKDCIVTMRVKFHRTVQNPIFAFTIKNSKGVEITGTNTLVEKKSIEAAYAKDIYEVKFRQKISLQGGEYLMSFGCTSFENSGLEVHHRLYDACSLSVIADRNTVGFYDMFSSAALKKISE